jgi:site-specific DNA recombinase
MTMAKQTQKQTIKTIKCAIYTRVSTDQGLEKDFNSLDAQREASEAYIKSQAHEGWTCLKQAYDDGGYSGGSLERPALQSLLDDVRAKEVDVIVVYKVDRLTRSLADFAKLVELFDARGVSFVSVTQSFNTTTSMGRLTLNVLLSFAQFEREVTGERVRDKVSASRKKGMWMGGVVPLGYRLENKKLLVEQSEVAKVKQIFALYLELKSLPKLATKLGDVGILSRQRTYHGSRNIGGIPFRTGALCHLLANRIYIGEVRHHKQHYQGEHEPIIDKAQFEAVQLELAARINRKIRQVHPSGSILRGLLFDSNGNRMVPAHANKAGVRYRYYQSWVLNHGQRDKAAPINRVPAPDIEEAVLKAMQNRTTDHEDEQHPDNKAMAAIEAISRIDVLSGQLKITFKSETLKPDTACDDEKCDQPPSLSIPWSKPPMRRKRELLCANSDQSIQRPMRSETRSRLLKGIAQGRIWLHRLTSNQKESVGSIAKKNKLSEKSVRSTLSLALLAPNIVEVAIDGQLPRFLTVTQMADLPANWQEQRKVLGLA